ncbi:hypothetical protein Droror1_Dr00000482 [Drosera rotundifolia]
MGGRFGSARVDGRGRGVTLVLSFILLRGLRNFGMIGFSLDSAGYPSGSGECVGRADVDRGGRALSLHWAGIRLRGRRTFWSSMFLLPKSVAKAIERIMARCTWIWRKLLSMRHLVRDLTAWRMGDGGRISLWYDSWLPTGPLVETLGSRAMERSGVSPDRVIRLPSPGGMFSIASAWRKLGAHTYEFLGRIVRFRGAVPRFVVIEWMVFMERLPTRHHLFALALRILLHASLADADARRWITSFFAVPFHRGRRLTVARHVPSNSCCLEWHTSSPRSPARHPPRRDRGSHASSIVSLLYRMERNKRRIGERELLWRSLVSFILASSRI